MTGVKISEDRGVPASSTLKVLDKDSDAWAAAEAQARAEQPEVWDRPMPRKGKLEPIEQRPCAECGSLYMPTGRGPSTSITCGPRCKALRTKRLDREKSKRKSAVRREKRSKNVSTRGAFERTECRECGASINFIPPLMPLVCVSCDIPSVKEDEDTAKGSAASPEDNRSFEMCSVCDEWLPSDRPEGSPPFVCASCDSLTEETIETEAKCNVCGKWSSARMSRPRFIYVCEECEPPNTTGDVPLVAEPIDTTAAELWLERVAMLHGKDILTDERYLRAVKLITWRQTGVKLEV